MVLLEGFTAVTGGKGFVVSIRSIPVAVGLSVMFNAAAGDRVL